MSLTGAGLKRELPLASAGARVEVELFGRRFSVDSARHQPSAGDGDIVLRFDTKTEEQIAHYGWASSVSPRGTGTQ